MSQPSSKRDVPFETVAIVGVGLIGGSIAAAVKQRRLCGRVIGVGRSAERLRSAEDAGLIDAGETELPAAARQADLLIVCTPVDRIAADVLEAARHCHPGALLTDVGSIKAAICRQLAGRLPEEVTFIGSHPLAGSEKNGFEHADAGLFDNRVCVVTPVAESSAVAGAPALHRSRLRGFWASLGMTVVETTPEKHDAILAVTSHVPHVAAAALATLLDDENRPFAATGFRDTTRIAGSDPALWTAILGANRKEVDKGLEELLSVLQQFRDALQQGDSAGLQNLLQAAKTERDRLNMEE